MAIYELFPLNDPMGSLYSGQYRDKDETSELRQINRPPEPPTREQ